MNGCKWAEPVFWFCPKFTEWVSTPIRVQIQLLTYSDAICKEENVNVPDRHKDILRYQFAAARYGKDFMKFNIEWHQKLLDEMRDEKQ